MLLSVLVAVSGCESQPNPDSPQPGGVSGPAPTPINPAPPPVLPASQPRTDDDYTRAACAALMAQDPIPGRDPIPPEACTAWVREFHKAPENLHLVPLTRGQLEQVRRLEGEPVSNLPQSLRTLAPHCAATLPIAITVVKELAGAAAEGTKGELPVQLLTGVGEIVVNDNKEKICQFLITELGN